MHQTKLNALLNYGYAILESEVRKCGNSIGLDVSVGFLHELADSKTPLVFDIQELFRWLVDLSVLQLLEEKKLKKGDFFIVTENYHIRLREQTAKMLIEKIKESFNRKVSYKGKHYSYRSILMDNLQQLASFITGKRKEDLQFNIPISKIERNDSLELQERIIAMTAKERRKLGINKSTLWYQKKKLINGKKIKVYGKVLAKFDNEV